MTAETPARASAGNGRPALMMAGREGVKEMQETQKSPIKWEKLEALKAQPAPAVLTRKINFAAK